MKHEQLEEMIAQMISGRQKKKVDKILNFSLILEFDIVGSQEKKE